MHFIVCFDEMVHGRWSLAPDDKIINQTNQCTTDTIIGIGIGRNIGIGQYIGFADMGNELSVSLLADIDFHIGR